MKDSTKLKIQKILKEDEGINIQAIKCEEDTGTITGTDGQAELKGIVEVTISINGWRMEES